MSCTSCSTEDGGKPSGCNSNGGCSTGGCNKLNTFDWLATMEIDEPAPFDVVEISFKNGSRKSFYYNPPQVRAIIGDSVVVEAANGYDIGRISLTGELVRLQMKKKRFSEENAVPKIIRRANERDLEKLAEVRSLEMNAMVRARAIARALGLEMKLGDVEYQGDRRKATFFYTADGRVDFRELIRHYAKEFKVKIEMRQIGARQESARVGGMGSCGRELCCSTWLTNFKSVTTGAARYQNLAINQSKLSGQCGRLKCCLNYELDTYLDALQDFPKNPDKLFTEAGMAVLIKTDIFKRSMVYMYQDTNKKGKFITISVERVKEVMAMNARKERPTELVDSAALAAAALAADEVMIDYDDVTGAIELPPEERRRKKKRGGNRNDRRGNSGGNRNDNKNRSNRTNRPENKEQTAKKGSPFKKERPNKREGNFKKDRFPKKDTPNNKNAPIKKDRFPKKDAPDNKDALAKKSRFPKKDAPTNKGTTPSWDDTPREEHPRKKDTSNNNNKVEGKANTPPKERENRNNKHKGHSRNNRRNNRNNRGPRDAKGGNEKNENRDNKTPNNKGNNDKKDWNRDHKTPNRKDNNNQKDEKSDNNNPNSKGNNDKKDGKKPE